MPNSLLLWLIALLLLLQGCSSGYAPVSERSLGARSESKGPAPSHYRVRRGDTLYSISFRYGLDYREVARWNGIDERYFIYPGQTLTLSQMALQRRQPKRQPHPNPAAIRRQRQPNPPATTVRHRVQPAAPSPPPAEATPAPSAGSGRTQVGSSPASAGGNRPTRGSIWRARPATRSRPPPAAKWSMPATACSATAIW